MRTIIITALAVGASLLRAVGMANDQSLAQTMVVQPSGVLISDDFVNALAGKLGVSADTVRTAMQQAEQQVPSPPTPGSVSAQVSSSSGTQVSSGPVQVSGGSAMPLVLGGPGDPTHFLINDTLVNALAGSLGLPADTDPGGAPHGCSDCGGDKLSPLATKSHRLLPSTYKTFLRFLYPCSRESCG